MSSDDDRPPTVTDRMVEAFRDGYAIANAAAIYRGLRGDEREDAAVREALFDALDASAALRTAERRGYDLAIERLRDTERYRRWFRTADCGIDLPPRQHLAHYLESVREPVDADG